MSAPGIAIIGAGIGGLTAALAFARQGIEAHVYEQAPQLGEVGAGLSLSPNAVKGMWFLGLKDRLAELADEPPVQVTRHYQTGEILIRVDRGDTTERYGAFEVEQLVQAWPSGNCQSDRVVVEAPLPGAAVRSPLVVSGRARGGWFFEGEVWLRLLDRDRNVLARGFASARAEWMTPGFVAFEGALEYPRRSGPRRGILVVRRNNPSDDRSLDQALEIPVVLE